MTITPAQCLASLGVPVRGLQSDSRAVRPGDLFLAYPGTSHDGRQFIAQALAQGAAAVLWEAAGFTWPAQWQCANLPVSGLREQAGGIADMVYGQPSRRLWMIGITGTNGKTSCSHWLAQALSSLERRTALIGTLGNGFPGALSAAINTTPDPIVLHGLLAQYLAQGAAGVAMEVSSHGLDQGRVNGVHFDVAVFTNLTRDHLDYHGDMAAYAAVKRRLFDWSGLGCAVLNADDAFGSLLAQELEQRGSRVMTYGLQSGTVRGENLALDASGLSMNLCTPQGTAPLRVPMLGRFNAFNLLAVAAALLASGEKIDRVAAALGSVRAIPGRMQAMGGGAAPTVVVDYAHTPDALEKTLASLREQTRGRLLCVFGCGGNRDKGKRPLMGRVASEQADEVILTSDNPRHEEPERIIEDVLTGVHGNCHVEADRAAAIDLALARAGAGDVVLIAGKGHEDYQDIGGQKLPFSDWEVAQRSLVERYPGVRS